MDYVFFVFFTWEKRYKDMNVFFCHDLCALLIYLFSVYITANFFVPYNLCFICLFIILNLCRHHEFLSSLQEHLSLPFPSSQTARLACLRFPTRFCDLMNGPNEPFCRVTFVLKKNGLKNNSGETSVVKR